MHNAAAPLCANGPGANRREAMLAAADTGGVQLTGARYSARRRRRRPTTSKREDEMAL